MGINTFVPSQQVSIIRKQISVIRLDSSGGSLGMKTVADAEQTPTAAFGFKQHSMTDIVRCFIRQAVVRSVLHKSWAQLLAPRLLGSTSPDFLHREVSPVRIFQVEQRRSYPDLVSNLHRVLFHSTY